jgi:citrate lyase beta subunit
MAEEPLAQQLTALAALLSEVDDRLSRSPVAPMGLEHLKQSVDSLRTSMWAVLSAGTGITAPTRVERLKLRRALEGLRVISEDLAARPGVARFPEHAELLEVARTLVAQLETPR